MEGTRPNSPEERPATVQRGAGWGFLLGIVLHVLVGGLLFAAVGAFKPDLAVLLLATCGLSQLIYMLPAILVARAQGRTGLARGLTLAAVITFLLSAGCWGLAALSF